MKLILTKTDERLASLGFVTSETCKMHRIKKKLGIVEACIADFLTEIYELPLEEQKMCAASLDDLAQAAAGAARGIRNPAEA